MKNPASTPAAAPKAPTGDASTAAAPTGTPKMSAAPKTSTPKSAGTTAPDSASTTAPAMSAAPKAPNAMGKDEHTDVNKGDVIGIQNKKKISSDTKPLSYKRRVGSQPKAAASTGDPKFMRSKIKANRGEIGKDEDGPSLNYASFNKPNSEKRKESEANAQTIDYSNMNAKNPTPKVWTGAKAKQVAVRKEIDRKANQTASEYFKEKYAKKAMKDPVKAKSVKSAIKRIPRNMIGKSEAIEASLNTPFVPRFLDLQELAKSSPKEVLAEISLAKMAEIIGKLAKDQTVTPEDVKSLQSLRSTYAKAEGYLKFGDHVPSEEPPRNKDKDPEEIKAEGSGGDVSKEELAPGDPNASAAPGQMGTDDRSMIKEELKAEFKPKFYKSALDKEEKGSDVSAEEDRKSKGLQSKLMHGDSKKVHGKKTKHKRGGHGS